MILKCSRYWVARLLICQIFRGVFRDRSDGVMEVHFRWVDITYNIMQYLNMNKSKQVFAIFLGKEACGKTRLLKRISDEFDINYASSHCCPIEIGVSHNDEYNLHIIDTPGSTSLGQECALHCALTFRPLNGIFIVIEYHPRIGSRMVDEFWETFQSRLKYEHLDMVTVLVTKLGEFPPG